MHQFQTSHLNNTIDLILSEAWDFKNPEDAVFVIKMLKNNITAGAKLQA
jgi:hypothetical protein